MRLLLAVVVGVAAFASIAACSKFDAALGQRQAIVQFTPNASVADRLAVRAACAKVPDVHPVALPSGVPVATALHQLVYQVNQASDGDIARLGSCLAKFGSLVAGMNLHDSSDDGGA